MNRRILSVLVTLLLPVICYPQVRPRPAAKPAAPPAYMQQLKSFEQEGSVTRVVFKNELTVLVDEAHATPLVEVFAWIKSGYRDDPADLNGISRLMEQLLWRGTTKRTAAALSADLKSLGGTVSSACAYDHTAFRGAVPAIQWKRVLEILSDVLLSALLDSQEIKRQAELISEESRYELSDQDVLADSRLLGTGFAGERLGMGRYTQSEAVAGISREKLLTAFRLAYAPARIVLCISGDVNASEVLAEVSRLYSQARISSAPLKRAAPKEVQPGLRYVQLRGSGRLGRLELGFRTVPFNSPDYPAVEMLRALLGTGEGSILNRRLKLQKNLIYRGTADQVAYDDVGYLRLRMELDAKDLDRTEIAMFTEFEILKQQEADEVELQRARAQLEREFWETSLNISARAYRLARFESSGSWKGIPAYLSRLSKVQWADIARVAARYLSLDNCALLEYLPAQSEDRNVTADSIRDTIRELLKLSAAEEMAEREKVTVPAISSASARPFTPAEVRYPFQMASILRGPELFIKEDHNAPYIHLGVFFAGGKLSESKTNAGITSLLLRSMLRDTKSGSAEQNYRQLEVYGASMTPAVEDDYFGVFFSISSANVEEGLNILTEMIKLPKLDAQEIERQKRLQLSAVQRRSDAEMARQRMREALFREFPYALDANGTEESIVSITPEAVQAWYKARVVDRKPMVVVIGDTQGTSLAGYFVRNFSGSRFQDAKIPEGFSRAVESKAAIEANWDGSASLVWIGFQAPPEDDEDSFPLLVLQSYASGLAGRLAERVQEDVPSAFHVSLDYQPELRGGLVAAFLASHPADEEQAWKALTGQLQRLATAPITYRDYRSAVNAATGGILIRQQNRFQLIADAVKSIVAGRGIEGFLEKPGRLQDVKQTDMQDVAQRILKLEKSVIVRLHGKDQR